MKSHTVIDTPGVAGTLTYYTRNQINGDLLGYASKPILVEFKNRLEKPTLTFEKNLNILRLDGVCPQRWFAQGFRLFRGTSPTNLELYIEDEDGSFVLQYDTLITTGKYYYSVQFRDTDLFWGPMSDVMTVDFSDGLETIEDFSLEEKNRIDIAIVANDSALLWRSNTIDGPFVALNSPITGRFVAELHSKIAKATYLARIRGKMVLL